MPRGEHLVEIVACVEPDWLSAVVHQQLTLRDSTGREFQHAIHYCAEDDAEERAGRDCYRSLANATGGPPVVGRCLWANVTDVVTYRAAMAPTSAQGAA